MTVTPKRPDPEKQFGAWFDLQQERYKKTNRKLKEDFVYLSTGDPLRQPFPPAKYHLETSFARVGEADQYRSTSPMYNLAYFQPFLREYGIKNTLGRDNLVAGNGCTQLYVAAIKKLLTPQDVLLIPVPSYGHYLRYAHANGIRVAPILLRAEDGFKLTPEYLNQEICRINKEFADSGQSARVSAFLNINPHNPTGAVYTKNDVKGLAAVLNDNNIRLVIDDMVYAGSEHGHGVEALKSHMASPMASVKGMFDKTVTLIGLSKSYSLPALRAGLAVGPSRFIKPMQEYISHEVEFTSHVAQSAMAATWRPEYKPQRMDYLREQGQEWANKYHLLRLMVNGWDNAPESREFFKGKTLDEVAAIAYPPYPFQAKTNNELQQLGAFVEDKRFARWLEYLEPPVNISEFIVKHSQNFTDENEQKRIASLLRQYYRRYEFEEQWASKVNNAVISKKREVVKHLMLSGIPGVNLLPTVESGFFALMDVSALKGKYYGKTRMADGVDMADALVTASNTTTLPGEAMGYYGPETLLRLSFSPSMDEICKGIAGIKNMVEQLKDLPSQGVAAYTPPTHPHDIRKL